MQTIIVDMTPGFRMPTIYYSQGDVGTQFAVDLRSRFGDSLPSGATVTIQATKPSGFGFSEAATSVTNGVAVFTTVAGMTDEAGRFAAELKVEASGITLFTANFYMNGEASTHPEGTIDGSEETVIPELTQLVERAEEAASSVLDRQTVTNTLPAGSQASYTFDEETNTQTFGIPQGEAGAGAAGVTASAYSSSRTYAVGDYVIHNSNLYRCTTAITTAEAFTAAHWTQVVLADDVADLKSDINEICDAVQLYIPQVASGVSPANSQANKILSSITLVSGHSYTYSIKYATASSKVSYLYLIDENINVLSSFTIPAGTTEKSQTFTANSNISNCALAINSAGNALNYEVSFVDNSKPDKTYIEELQEDVADIRTEIIDLHDAHIEEKNIGKTANLEMTSSSLVAPASDQPKRITIYFPCVQGVKYTVDKKYRTQYFRLGYTSNEPANGSAISGYEVLSSMTNHISFIASYNGYACMKIYDASVDTANYNDVLNACVAYEGDYDSTITQTAEKLKDLDGLTFYCGAHRALNTLKAGIEEATKYMDSTLYVDAGVYDLVSEFGSAWFEGLTSLDTMSGLMLKNRVHIVFSPNSKVVSHYNGNNQYAMSLYSPFNAGEYGFTLENLNLDCSRCRYGIHDERNSNTEEYKAHYINCKMKIDNSNNSAWSAKHCIGGGLGTNAEILIENCLFESDDASTSYGVSYHIPNVATDDYRAIIMMKDNYFITGCISLDDVGATPASDSDNSEYIFTNNSFPMRYSGASSQGIRNSLTKSYNIRAWNNEIRN